MGFAPIKWTCTAFFRPRQLTDRAILASRQTQEKKKVFLKLPNPAVNFFCCERLSASMAMWYPVAAFELYLYTAVDSRPGPGGSRTTASCQASLRPLGHGRYRFATASAVWLKGSSSACRYAAAAATEGGRALPFTPFLVPSEAFFNFP